MSFGSRLIDTFLTFVFPFVTALLIGFLCFTMGSRYGSNYQYSQDQVLLEVCIEDVIDLKDQVQQLQSADAGLVLDKTCSRVCDAIEMASDGFISSTSSFKAPTGECVCFVRPDL